VNDGNVTSFVPHTVLRAENISKVYGRGAHALPAVSPIDVEFTSRSAVGIVGESGSGKSTLSRILVGLERPTTGTVTLSGRDIATMEAKTASYRELRRTVQYVAQDTSSSFDPRRTLKDAVATPLRVLRGVTGDEARIEIGEILDLLRLDPAQLERYPSEVSGGQRQRFALARALVVRPRLLFCDEVVSALDVSVQGAVLNTVKAYCESHSVGLVFVSHGLPATAFISTHLLVMRHGAVVEYGPTQDLIDNPRHPYTATLLAAHTREPAHVLSAVENM
jgi:ABC-type dipeptide/oligopeptide/nickel transport system ATPase subunit